MPSLINKDRSGRRGFWIRTLADPVLLYTVLVMMSLMFHYRNRTTTAETYSKFVETIRDLRSSFVYGIVTYVAGWLLFRLYDFMQEHKVIGTIGFIAVSAAVLMGADAAIYRGYATYPIDWMVWMLTPQESMTYNGYYALSVFLLFFMFMATVIYYFTRVRYRILMNFLIFIIPFAIYGKEYEKMPIGFIILLAVGYMLLMVTFRQLSDSEKVTVVEKPETWKAVAVYTVIFALVSTLLPKPEIEADRTYIESLINAEAFTDRLDALLNAFRDSSDGTQFRGRGGNAPVYYSDSTLPLDIKIDTYSTYNFGDDGWYVGDSDDHYAVCEELPVNINHNGDTPNALFLAAGLDSSFAAKYGLEEYAGRILDMPEERKINFYAVRSAAKAPVPEGAHTLDSTSFGSELCNMRSGVVMTDLNTSFRSGEKFTFTFRPEGFFEKQENCEIVDMLGSREDYADMIKDAYAILFDEYKNFSGDKAGEYYERLNDACCDLNFTSKYMDDIMTDLLDYGNSERIRQLAEEVTAGDRTDYEKAKTLEYYFINNDYRYDLNYIPPAGDNIEDFLFDKKVGVCREYATGMVLMARSLGIPARYCEGFRMQEEADPKSVGARYMYNQTGIDVNYTAQRNNGHYGFLVTDNDRHGFPELYIKGYGWKVFEPTMTAGSQNTDQKGRTTSGLSRMGLFILAAAVLALLLMIAWPVLSHKLFMFINRRRQPAEQVKACMHRICKIYGAGSEYTSQEAAALAAQLSGADVSGVAALFDKAAYGDAELDSKDAERAATEYVKAYEALRDAKRAARKERRRKRAV